MNARDESRQALSHFVLRAKPLRKIAQVTWRHAQDQFLPVNAVDRQDVISVKEN